MFFFIVGGSDDEVFVYHQGADGDFSLSLCFFGLFDGQFHVFCIGHGDFLIIIHGFFPEIIIINVEINGKAG